MSESREHGEAAECRACPGNRGSDVMNELWHCHDAAASCLYSYTSWLYSLLTVWPSGAYS
jgi:hypothetical protein